MIGTGGKLFAGVAATMLLGLVSHAVTADKIVDGLETSAQDELQARGLEGVTVAFDSDPMSRSARLDGDVDATVKQEALATVLSIAGVTSARWQGDKPSAIADRDPAGLPGSSSDPATQQNITQCQNSIDAITGAQKIVFRSGSAYVSPESNRILDEIAAALKSCSGLAIAVGGHTDNKGDADVNKDMSQERAERIRSGLIARGISEHLVTATGYGAQQPLETGGNAATDAQNRRIEFKIGAADRSKNDVKAQQGG